MAKKDSFKFSSELSGLFQKLSDAEAESRGEVYRVQPVDLDTFVTSHEYLNQGRWGMSEAQREFLEVGTDLENGTTFMVLWVGKGGGKNWSSGVLFLYVVYKLLCMYDPHEYLDHNASKDITLLNVAINSDQARDNFFTPMANILKNAGPKAFRDFGFNPDTDIQTKRVTFPKNIQIISANSRAGGIEGLIA